MGEIGHTVCVRGLPTDLEHERLEDKLLIHFLRERNGGGEICSISLKAADPCAMITFEDRKVALNVCSHKPHVLEVDGRMYELSLSFPWQESHHLDKVFLDMRATIDCSHLPLGETTIKTLTEKFPDLGVHYIKPLRHCTIKGPYSLVNYVITHLIELLVDMKKVRSTPYRGLFGAQAHSHQKGENNPLDQPHGFLFDGAVSLHRDYRDPSPKVSSIKQSLSDERTTDWADALDMEALSLIMEADVFAYLCSRSEEYRTILDKHGVNVVDVTSAGVTTVYLQYNANGEVGPKAEEHLNHAREELSHLYQQVEGNLQRAQIPKSALNLHVEEKVAFKDLESLLPKVLVNFDQNNVYVVGESSDVSQAKQILLFGSSDDNLRAKQENSLQSSPSYSPVSEPETSQKAVTRSESNTVAPKMRSSVVERRLKNGEEYKLAARFKNSDMGLLGFGPVEKGRSKDLQDSTQGINTPTLASYSTSGTGSAVSNVQARTSQVSAFKVSGVNIVEDDILFQKMEHQSYTRTSKNTDQVVNEVSRRNSPNCTSRVTSSFQGPLSAHADAHTELEKVGKSTGTAVESTTTATSSLKRTSSLSDRPLQKQETQKPGNNENSCLAVNSFQRQRSRSLNSRISAEVLPSSTVSKAITIPTKMWRYIKKAYHSELHSLLSDVQVSEKNDKNKTLVMLKGLPSSKVEECQRDLQKLVDVIGLDFCVQRLELADFGATRGDDVFKEACLNICSYFSKIVVWHVKDDISLAGPRSQCCQVMEMLKELFPNGSCNSGSLVNTSSMHQGSTDQRQANASSNQTPIRRDSQRRPNQTANSEQSRNGAYKRTRMPISNEMLKKACDLEKNKTGPVPGKSSEVSGVLLGLRDNWQAASSLTTQKRQNATTLALKQTNLPISKQLVSCVCGENGAQTSCGVFLCSNCIRLHAQCILCSKANEARKEMQVHPLKEAKNIKEIKGNKASTRQNQERGIRGTMSCTELPVSLPGYEQYRTAKITYCIPDGIQGEDHPNPGLPFQGAVFEAYLPLSSQGQELLQCLEKAFQQGFTFTVRPTNDKGRAKLTWSRIPHKTNITGGESRNGYPDVKYLKDLSEALRTCGITGV